MIKKGAFDWSDRARREAEAEARVLADMERRQRKEPQGRITKGVSWVLKTLLVRTCRKC